MRRLSGRASMWTLVPLESRCSPLWWDRNRPAAVSGHGQGGRPRDRAPDSRHFKYEEQMEDAA